MLSHWLAGLCGLLRCSFDLWGWFGFSVMVYLGITLLEFGWVDLVVFDVVDVVALAFDLLVCVVWCGRCILGVCS